MQTWHQSCGSCLSFREHNFCNCKLCSLNHNSYSLIKRIHSRPLSTFESILSVFSLARERLFLVYICICQIFRRPEIIWILPNCWKEGCQPSSVRSRIFATRQKWKLLMLPRQEKMSFIYSSVCLEKHLFSGHALSIIIWHFQSNNITLWSLCCKYSDEKYPQIAEKILFSSAEPWKRMNFHTAVFFSTEKRK